MNRHIAVCHKSGVTKGASINRRGGGQRPSEGGVALSQLLILVFAKSGVRACKCSVTALRTTQATETRLRAERRLSSRYSSAGRVTDSRTVEGAAPVLLGWTDMTTSYYITVVQNGDRRCLVRFRCTQYHSGFSPRNRPHLRQAPNTASTIPANKTSASVASLIRVAP